MSFSKRLMEHNEEQRTVAIRIAIEADVLKQCENHSDCFFAGGSDVVSAYKLGNYKFKQGEIEGVFDSPREMTDKIKALFEEHSGIDECPRCAKMLAD